MFFGFHTESRSLCRTDCNPPCSSLVSWTGLLGISLAKAVLLMINKPFTKRSVHRPQCRQTCGSLTLTTRETGTGQHCSISSTSASTSPAQAVFISPDSGLSRVSTNCLSCWELLISTMLFGENPVDILAVKRRHLLKDLFY